MISFTVSVVVATFVLVIQTTAFKLDSLRTSPLQKRSASQLDISSIRDALDGMDTELVEKQKRTCAIGINSHHCALANVDDRMLSREWLNNGYSPGKRDGENTSTEPADHAQAHSQLQKIAIQRQAITTLKRLLMNLKKDHELASGVRKRSCSFRLGGHCLTESLDRAASQYYYLRSPDSPGKRRKRALTAPHKP